MRYSSHKNAFFEARHINWQWQVFDVFIILSKYFSIRFWLCLTPKLILYNQLALLKLRALASHQCIPGSNPGVDAICGLSLLLVLSLAPTGFSPGAPVYPLLKSQHFQIRIRSGTQGHVLTSSWTRKCSVGKQITIINYYFARCLQLFHHWH